MEPKAGFASVNVTVVPSVTVAPDVSLALTLMLMEPPARTVTGVDAELVGDPVDTLKESADVLLLVVVLVVLVVVVVVVPLPVLGPPDEVVVVVPEHADKTIAERTATNEPLNALHPTPELFINYSLRTMDCFALSAPKKLPHCETAIGGRDNPSINKCYHILSFFGSGLWPYLKADRKRLVFHRGYYGAYRARRGRGRDRGRGDPRRVRGGGGA
jgi:hypothetical protein